MHTVISRVACERVHECTNNKCIFRLQTIFGLGHFQQHIGLKQALIKAGVNYAEYPKFELVSRPYGMGVSCKNFIGTKNEQ